MGSAPQLPRRFEIYLIFLVLENIVQGIYGGLVVCFFMGIFFMETACLSMASFRLGIVGVMHPKQFEEIQLGRAIIQTSSDNLTRKNTRSTDLICSAVTWWL